MITLGWHHCMRIIKRFFFLYLLISQQAIVEFFMRSISQQKVVFFMRLINFKQWVAKTVHVKWYPYFHSFTIEKDRMISTVTISSWGNNSVYYIKNQMKCVILLFTFFKTLTRQRWLKSFFYRVIKYFFDRKNGTIAIIIRLSLHFLDSSDCPNFSFDL